MIPILIIFLCAAVWIAMLLSIFCGYHLGRYRGWNEVTGTRTQYQKYLGKIFLETMTTHIIITEDRTIHHAFTPPKYRCQVCGSDDELAYMWKCSECGMMGNGKLHIHTGERAV